MAGIAVCFFFVMAVDTMYQGYCGAQLGSAYSYSGKWDVCVKIAGEDYARFSGERDGLQETACYSTTYNLRLDAVPEEYIYSGLKEYVTHYYLAVRGITPDGENVLPYQLTQGRWPKTENEIVVPETLQYQGLDASVGTIRIGDQLTFEYGRRLNEEGIYTQGEVSGKENFELCGEREYTVCGFIEYPDYTTDHFVLYGYVGLEAAAQYPGEELIVYYKMIDPTVRNLNAAVQRMAADDGVISVESNTYLATALEVVEHSDYMHSIRLGLYLFEGLLVFIGLCIAGANQYQSIVEDKRQIGRLYSIGAGKGQLCTLYASANFIVVLVGLVFSFGLYSIFLLLIRSTLLSKLRQSIFNLEIYSLDFRLLFFTFALVTAMLMLIVCRLVLAQIPARREAGKKKRRAKQPELSALSGLAVGNNRAMRGRYRIQALISCVVLFTVPVFLSVFLSAYRIGVQIAGQWSADFYCEHSGYHTRYEGLTQELRDSSYVRDFAWESFGPRQVCIPAEYLPEEIVYFIQHTAITTEYTEDHTLHDGIYLIFINEEYYNDLNEKNGGTLPPYEDFASGDNCLVYANCLLPEGGTWEGKDDYSSGTWVDLGKIISENTEVITFYPYVEEDGIFSLNLIASFYEWNSDDVEVGLNLRFLAPEHVYEDYCKDRNMYIGTHYRINGYNGSLAQVWEKLKELRGRYDIVIQDNVSESSAAKDAVAIQYVTSLSCVVIIVLLCACALGIMGKVDFVARRRTYDIYRMLGLDWRRAFLIQLSEQLLPFTSAMLLSVLLHYAAALTFLRNVYNYYGIMLKEIGGFFVLTIAGMLVLLTANAFWITKRRYYRAVTFQGGDAQ